MDAPVSRLDHCDDGDTHRNLLVLLVCAFNVLEQTLHEHGISRDLCTSCTPGWPQGGTQRTLKPCICAGSMIMLGIFVTAHVVLAYLRS